ncbi:unnamed protein product [Effrenium voratum]|nr:unnamed protein product [Effrenium voratum]
MKANKKVLEPRQDFLSFRVAPRRSEQAPRSSPELAGHPTVQEMVNAVWAYAQVVFCRQRLLDSIGETAILHSSEWHPRDLANAVQARARLVAVDKAPTSAASKASLAQIWRMNQQDLANSAWCFTSLEAQGTASLGATAGRLLELLEASPELPEAARDVALLAWALAKLALAELPVMGAAAALSLRQIRARSSGPQASSNTAWAFATSATRSEPLSGATARLSLEKLVELDAQELTNTSWALAEARHRSLALIEASSVALGQFLGEGMSQEEASRGGYAMAWAQDRHGRPDLTRKLVSQFMAEAKCHSMAWGLVIQDEEWRRRAPPNGAAAALQASKPVSRLMEPAMALTGKFSSATVVVLAYRYRSGSVCEGQCLGAK